MTAMLLSMVLAGKNYNIKYKHFLSNFKIWNQKQTQKIGLSFERT
jgi:hypothetical protein